MLPFFFFYKLKGVSSRIIKKIERPIPICTKRQYPANYFVNFKISQFHFSILLNVLKIRMLIHGLSYSYGIIYDFYTNLITTKKMQETIFAFGWMSMNRVESHYFIIFLSDLNLTRLNSDKKSLSIPDPAHIN
jgi:hypothetical protein